MKRYDIVVGGHPEPGIKEGVENVGGDWKFDVRPFDPGRDLEGLDSAFDSEITVEEMVRRVRGFPKLVAFLRDEAVLGEDGLPRRIATLLAAVGEKP